MEKMIAVLERLGISEDECKRIVDFYRDDIDGLTMFVLHIKAMFDDAHEYID